jgi:hypothetical protein
MHSLPNSGISLRMQRAALPALTRCGAGEIMSLVAIVNLAERLLNQTFEQGQDASSNAKQGKTQAPNPAAGPTFEDQFIPSAVNGPISVQEAGLFHVQRFALFSAAADFLLSQPAGPTSPPAGTQAPAKAAATEAPTQPPPPHQVVPVNLSPIPTVSLSAAQPHAPTESTRSQEATLNSTNQTEPPAATEEVQAAQSVPQLASTAAQPNPQSQLQALNNALAALGLTAADIAIIDRIAALIRDFNPAAFASLVLQLQDLAGANSPARANDSAAPASALLPEASANNFQIQELVVRFSAVNETLQSGDQAGSTTAQFSAFNLQVEGIRLTFTNGSGQTLQVEAPQNAANANGSSAQSASTRAQSASA